MNNKELAERIIEEVGGSQNITNLTHCVTRLRFNLRNVELADKNTIKNLEGVVGAIYKGGQYQVIIGPHVQSVYEEALNFVDGTLGDSNDEDTGPGGVAAFFDTIAGIFTPIVGALAGSGMVKAILAVGTAAGWLSPESTTYTFLNVMGDSVFYFLPFFIAVTASKKFKTSPFLALVFAGILLHPDISALRADGVAATFLGAPVRLATYSSSVIPIILIVFLQSFIEKYVRKYTPDVVKVFVVPMITILIVAPIGLIILGPAGSIVGDYLAAFFTFLETKASWVVPFIVAGVFPLLVMTGMHYSVGAAQAVQRSITGYGSIFTPASLSANMAQGGAMLAVALRTKNSKLKSVAYTAGISCFMGISEPALYGVTLQRKRTLASVMMGGAIAGLYAGITGIKTYSSGTSNIFSVPIYLGGDSMWNFYNAIITLFIGAIAGFVLSYLLYKEEEETVSIDDKKHENNNQTEESSAQIGTSLSEKNEIYSPVEGRMIQLKEVDDDAFSTEAMGKGIAVLPETGKVYAPFDGKVEMIFNTKHAVGLKSKTGVELLIHIGIDTVKLDGNHFFPSVNVGDSIVKGDVIVEFDKQALIDQGYDITTPVIVTNTNEYLDVIEADEGKVSNENLVMTVIK